MRTPSDSLSGADPWPWPWLRLPLWPWLRRPQRLRASLECSSIVGG